MTSPGPVRKRPKPSNAQSPSKDDVEEQSTQMRFSFEEICHVLYGKNKEQAVDVVKLQQIRSEQKSKTYCVVCRVDRPPNGCPFHELSSAYTADQDDRSLSYAIKSFPAEVQLCTSSIPGAYFGVCAKRVIPEGTWIGPYEGRRVSPEDLSKHRDNPYIWEIYEKGQASYYIDGSDESMSSWMRFIRCARHKDEQNLYAFQYLGNVFYRSFKDIVTGTEMLVWYDDKYPQYMGIPTGLQEIEFVSSSDVQGKKSPKIDQSSTTDDGPSTRRTDCDVKQETSKEQSQQLLAIKVKQQLPYTKRERSALSPAGRHNINPARRKTPSGPPPVLHTIPSFTSSKDARVLSPQGIMGSTIAPQSVHPIGSLVATQARVNPPACAYGTSYQAQPHIPVNISAGLPSQSVSGRAHSGITGAHIPRVHENVLDKAPTRLYHHPASTVVSVVQIDPQTGLEINSWTPNTLESPPSVTMGTVSHSHTVAKLLSQPHTFTSNEARDNRGHFDKYPVVSLVSSAAPTSRVQHSELKNSSDSADRLTISPHASSEFSVSSADDSRFVPVSGRGRAARGGRMFSKGRQSSSWKDVSNRDSLFPSDERDDFAAESDSNSSGNSNAAKDDGTCPGVDEISMWRCRQCQKTFTQRVMLQVHVCTHQPIKPFRCGQCELPFSTSTELRGHVDTHTSEKPFKCGFCSRSFAGATTLNNHIRTHMGKRPFRCDRCGKNFAQAGQLARHQRTPAECEQLS